MASIDDKIPTNAVIPMVMIKQVINVRSLLIFIESNESLTVSLKFKVLQIYTVKDAKNAAMPTHFYLPLGQKLR